MNGRLYEPALGRMLSADKGYHTKDGVWDAGNNREFRAHLQDINLAPSQNVPARDWFSSVKALKDYGYNQPIPNTLRWWNIFFNIVR